MWPRFHVAAHQTVLVAISHYCHHKTSKPPFFCRCCCRASVCLLRCLAIFPFFFSFSLMPVSDTTYRSSRPSIPSPLSTPSYTASSLASSASPSWPGAATSQKRPPPIDTRSRGNTTPSSAGHTTFFSDSSNPSSPEEESPRCVTNDTTAQCRILCLLRAHP